MKILELTSSLGSGGAEQILVDLSNHLCEENDVFLVQIKTNAVEANSHYLQHLDKRVKYINLECHSVLDVKPLWKVYRTIRSISPDIVHVHCSALVLSLTVLLFRKTHYFHTLHSMAHYCCIPKSCLPWFRCLYRYFVTPVTISRLCQESYEKLLKLRNSALVINGRSPLCLTANAKTVHEEVEAMKNHPDDKVFVHVARFHPVKNQSLLFETFRRLNEEGAHVILIVVGNGFQDSPLIEYSGKYNIHIVGEKKNVGDFLAAADYFILSSKLEGLPLSLLEAMSMGVIPVVTPVGGVPEVVENGVTGYLSRSVEADDYYNCVKQAVRNEGNVSTEHLKSVYEEKYSMRACSAAYQRLFRKTLETK